MLEVLRVLEVHMKAGPCGSLLSSAQHGVEIRGETHSQEGLHPGKERAKVKGPLQPILTVAI